MTDVNLHYSGVEEDSEYYIYCYYLRNFLAKIGIY